MYRVYTDCSIIIISNNLRKNDERVEIFKMKCNTTYLDFFLNTAIFLVSLRVKIDKLQPERNVYRS